MRRKLVLFVAVWALLWQGLAGAGLPSLAKVAADAAHAALHWNDVGHHHHADGSVHADASQASIEHVALDGSNQVASPLAVPGLSFALPLAGLPHYWAERLPNPHLDPLHRPPRTLS
ncbi:MAG: hypothetical protein Q7T22_06310 [Serpentinimonas sp.]|jgi:hypothetical protein|nr:hypothetical protein [Serpentinimonas sp.]MDO9611601.1 hypothetical protein [Serpentinimonas sp.]